MTTQEEFFTPHLLQWHRTVSRPLPWKGIDDPYLIWLSEIILQQTRVEQGLPYYNRFKAAYPNIQDMAEASEDEIMKLWEGLGYYSRAKNMHFTAKYITYELNGIFPDTYPDILTLKGVGQYTAAAIASFAFGLPHAVVDGNVYRVLSRFFGIDTPIDTTTGKKLFADLAQRLLDTSNPGGYNQAIMDFGATHCTPKLPKCKQCPLSDNCIALQKDLVDKLPIKSKKIKKRARFFNYLILNYQGDTLLSKRAKKDIWQGLYEFPLIESTALITAEEELKAHTNWAGLLDTTPFSITSISKPFRQVLTHQKITAIFWEIELSENKFTLPESTFWTNRKELNNFAFPKIIDLYLRDKALYLKLL